MKKRNHIEKLMVSTVYHKFTCTCGKPLVANVGDIEPLSYKVVHCKCGVIWDVERRGKEITQRVRER